MSWRLLLTRPADDCAVLAQQLADAGHFGACLPLLAIEPLAETPQQRSTFLDFDHYEAIVVVSKPAARLALERLDQYWPQPPVGQQWFAVGAATGSILDDYGLPVCWPQSGDDSEALLALPEWEALLEVPGARVLILRGEEGRPWLGEQLRARGASVDYLPLYRRVCPAYPAGELRRRIEGQKLDGLMVSSGEGLARLIELAGNDWPLLAGMPLFVPSPRVAAQAEEAGARDVRDCRGASAAALLARLAAQAPHG